MVPIPKTSENVLAQSAPFHETESTHKPIYHLVAPTEKEVIYFTHLHPNFSSLQENHSNELKAI